VREAGTVVDITDVIEEGQGPGPAIPGVDSFQDILRHRVEAINQAFAASIAEFNYQTSIAASFPSRSTNCAKWWRKSWTRASRSNLGWKWGASRNCSPAWPCKTRLAA